MHQNDHDKAPDHDQDGPMILSHDAVEGYRPVFYICIGLGILYLAFIFWQTW